MTKDDVIDIIRDAGYGFVATVEGEQPRVRPLMPYFDEELNHFLIALGPSSRTKDQIQENSKIEICFVDRNMSFCRIVGVAVISEELERKECIWDNSPMMKQFFTGPEDPNLTLLIVKPENVEAMTPHLQAPEKISFA